MKKVRVWLKESIEAWQNEGDSTINKIAFLTQSTNTVCDIIPPQLIDRVEELPDLDALVESQQPVIGWSSWFEDSKECYSFNIGLLFKTPKGEYKLSFGGRYSFCSHTNYILYTYDAWQKLCRGEKP